jgi:hypothetical protein
MKAHQRTDQIYEYHMNKKLCQQLVEPPGLKYIRAAQNGKKQLPTVILQAPFSPLCAEYKVVFHVVSDKELPNTAYRTRRRGDGHQELHTRPRKVRFTLQNTCAPNKINISMRGVVRSGDRRSSKRNRHRVLLEDGGDEDWKMWRAPQECNDAFPSIWSR